MSTELTLRLRDPLFPVLLLFVLAGCALLVPDPAAGYAVVTIDHKKPVMSADTALVAAAVVLCVLLFPVYALALDIGHARDRRLRLDQLHLTSPVHGVVVAFGRLLSIMAFALLTASFSLLVVSSTVLARYGLPAPSALLLFLLIVAPVGMLAALFAGVLDRFLPDRNGVKTAIVFSVWVAAIGLSVATRLDAFAFRYLVEHTKPGGHAPNLAVGVIETRHMPSVIWKTAPLTAGFSANRLGLALGIAAAAAAVAFLLRFRVTNFQSAEAGPVLAAPRLETRPVLPVRFEAIERGTTSTFAAALCIAQRSFGPTRLAWAALGLALLLALRHGGAPGAAFAVALTAPMIILSRTSVPEIRVAATLERTTAALTRPSPTLMHGWVLILLVVASTLPALVRMVPIQGATATLGVIASTLWLVWTHRCVGRSLLGIATFAALWYFDVFNDVPPAVDLLGLWHANAAALQITAVAACFLVFLIARHDGLLRSAGSKIV